jgi:hypothetical protein
MSKLQELLESLCTHAEKSGRFITRLGHFAHACVYVVATGNEGFPVPDDAEPPFVEDAIAFDEIVWTEIEGMTDDAMHRLRLVAVLLEMIASAMVVVTNEGEMQSFASH